MASDLPSGSLRERLALCEPVGADAPLCPDALEAQRLVLAAVSAVEDPLPGVVREPTLPVASGAANEDAAAPPARPNPISSPATPLFAASERSSGPPAAASPAEDPGELVRFTPVRTRRLVASLAALVALAAAAVAAYAAWQSRDTTSVGLAAGLGAVTLLLLRLRAGVTTAHVTIDASGRLEIRRGTSRTVFDLASGYTPIDELGEPTDRSWRVLIQRKGMRPFVVDRRLVRPQEFSPVLRRYVPSVIQ